MFPPSGGDITGGAADSSTGTLGNSGSFGPRHFGGIHFGSDANPNVEMSKILFKGAALLSLTVTVIAGFKYLGGKI